ncbi:hypothetical protein Ancab_014723 [Ancistrocladus abbreviatus]
MHVRCREVSWCMQRVPRQKEGEGSPYVACLLHCVPRPEILDWLLQLYVGPYCLSLIDFVFLLSQEPVAFMGGVFAGILRLDMNDDPLKEWIRRTVEAAGITEDEIGPTGSSTVEDDMPQQMQIE